MSTMTDKLDKLFKLIKAEESFKPVFDELLMKEVKRGISE